MVGPHFQKQQAKPVVSHMPLAAPPLPSTSFLPNTKNVLKGYTARRFEVLTYIFIPGLGFDSGNYEKLWPHVGMVASERGSGLVS